MHLIATLLAAGSSSSSTAKTSAGSSAISFLFLAIIFGAGYFFFVRPRSQAARRQRDTIMELGVGDEVLTAAGIFGRVLDVEPDRVTLETAPGTRLTVLRSTIARHIPDATQTAPTWDEHDDVEAHGAYDEFRHDGDDDEEHDDDAEGHDTVDDEHDDDDDDDDDDDGVEDHDGAEDEHDDDEDDEDEDDEGVEDHDAADAADDEDDESEPEQPEHTDGAADTSGDAVTGGRRRRRGRRDGSS